MASKTGFTEENDSDSHSESSGESLFPTIDNTNMIQISSPANASEADLPRPKTFLNSWNNENIAVLIELFKHHREKIDSGRYKKKEMWLIVAKEMQERGYLFRGNECHDKYRSLVFRYNKIRSDSLIKGGNPRPWPWYNVMHEILMTEQKHDTTQNSVGLLNINNPNNLPIMIVDVNGKVESIIPSSSNPTDNDICPSTPDHGYHKMNAEGDFENEDDSMLFDTNTNDKDDGQSKNPSKSRTGDLWPHEAVIQFIHTIAENREKFSSGIKQKVVWEMVAQEMLEKGFIYKGSDCYEKFRSLRYRHKLITDAQRLGKNGRCWQYYDMVDDLLQGDLPIGRKKCIRTPNTTEKAKPSQTSVYTDSSEDDCESPPTKRWKPSSSSKPDQSTEHFAIFNLKMDKLLENQSRLIEVNREGNALLSKLLSCFKKK